MFGYYIHRPINFLILRITMDNTAFLSSEIKKYWKRGILLSLIRKFRWKQYKLFDEEINRQDENLSTGLGVVKMDQIPELAVNW